MHTYRWENQNKSYYTEAIGASKLHDLLSSHHRIDEKDNQMPVGDFSKREGKEVICEDHIPAFSTCWTAQFFLKRSGVPIFHTSSALTLTALQSSSVAEW